MSFTVFLGNLPVWVTADDIRSWLTAEGLVSDAVKVIRNPETQESKGFAFIDAPNAEEMNSIIRRFDRAPLEDRLLRANPAQPPKSKTQQKPAVEGPRGSAQQPSQQAPAAGAVANAAPNNNAGATAAAFDRNRRGGKKHKRPQGPQSAFAEELAKAL
jgi:RNA recognition motif-containing protein